MKEEKFWQCVQDEALEEKTLPVHQYLNNQRCLIDAASLTVTISLTSGHQSEEDVRREYSDYYHLDQEKKNSCSDVNEKLSHRLHIKDVNIVGVVYMTSASSLKT